MNNHVSDFIVSLLEKKMSIPKKQRIYDYRFFEAGHIDSLSVMSFILNLEDEFGVLISDEDMISEQFQTIGGLSELIAKKVELNSEQN